MIEEPSGIFVLKVDIVAAGTLLRVGARANDFRPVEELTLGEEVFDPIEERLIEITEMACVTLDADTVRDRGFSPKVLAGTPATHPLLYAIKVPTLVSRAGYVPPIRGEFQLPEGTVFFALGFERRAVLESPASYLEFMRASNYGLETGPRRSGAMPREEIMPSLR